MIRSRSALTAVFLLLLSLAPAAHAEDASLPTRVSLLVGFPSEDPASGDDDRGVLVLPGTVLPIQSTSAPDQTFITKEQEHSLRLTNVGTQLVESFNLGRFEVVYSIFHDLEINTPRPLPGPTRSTDVSLQVEMLGFNHETASYEAKMFEGSTVIAEPRLIAERGKQAVIGSTNGEDAPYLFLVIEPAPPTPKGTRNQAGPYYVGGDVVPPRVVTKTPPQYTELARKERTQGVVIVQATIAKTGTVDNIQVLKGLPNGLDQAAVDAISTWQFEPATLDGTPVAVYYNLTINFRLDAEKSKEDE